MQVNSANGATWVAEVSPRFAGMTEEDFKVLLGAKPEFSSPTPIAPQHNDDTSIPDFYDPRDVWPSCETIGYPFDQGHCGSCWAMCSFEVLQDRFCIASNGTEKPWLSGQEITSCDRNSNACNGSVLFSFIFQLIFIKNSGWSKTAFNYAHKSGVSLEECIPYEMGRCLHPGCSLWPTPRCSTTCTAPVLAETSV